MKSIRTKITLCLIVTVVTALVAAGISGIIPNYRSTITTVDHMMSETAVLAAERVEQELTAYRNVAMDTGCIPQLSDPEISPEEKKSIIDERCSMHNFQRGNIIGTDGISIFDGKDYSDREYVQQAMQGNIYVSEPLISKITGELSIMVAAPLYADGTHGGTIAGVVYFVPPETFLNNIVSSIQIGENSRAYMINKSGDTIADITLDTITVQNIEAESGSDSSLKDLASLHAAMRRGENGFGSYDSSAGKMFMAYAPVNGTDGWSIAVTAPQLNYLSTTYKGMSINILVMIGSVLISIVVALLLAGSISKPMKACAKRMQLLVEGDLETPMPKINSKDETGMLARSTTSLVEGLGTVINDISYLLTQLANQNLDVHTSREEVYVGSFRNILLSMRHMKVELSHIIRQVNASSNQVASASSQLSSSAQTLSQGTVEQASAVEELASQVTEISSQAKHTAAGAVEVRSQTHRAGEEVSQCNQQMQKLMDAMNNIQTCSNEIEKILKTIEDIAFQTNILALNAAVEAARAGSAGKGFSVVVDEVRNLAAKSAAAAQNTNQLISRSIQSAKTGSESTDLAVSAMRDINSCIQSIKTLMDEIAAASVQQSEMISLVETGIKEISVVVQSNSAAAEKSAAVSRELSQQARALNGLIRRFRI